MSVEVLVACAVNMSGATLVVPSFGPIDSIAIDMLLSSLLRKSFARFVTHMSCAHVENIAGAGVFADCGGPKTTSSLELYCIDRSHGLQQPVYVLQQRGRVKPAAQELWALALCKWAIQAGAGRLIITGTASSACRPDVLLQLALQDESILAWHVVVGQAARKDSVLQGMLQAAGGTELPAEARAPAGDTVCEPADASLWPEWEPLEPAVHAAVMSACPAAGLGYGPAILRRAASGIRTESGLAALPAALLFTFASEGDNTVEASHLAALLARACGQEQLEIEGPQWWKQAVEGPAIDQSMYG